MRFPFSALALITASTAIVSPVEADSQFVFRQDFLQRLVKLVPGILKSQDPQTGRFGEGVWISQDQNVILALAAVWSAQSDSNPYYHDATVLQAIMDGGDALIEAQDRDGKWEFRKKDNSFWGMIYMPWTYSRWLRSFGIIREAMPGERRKRWEDALILGYTGISKTCLGGVHNIATHHAMALYHAGRLFGRPEWCAQATAYMATVVAAQDPAGFWSEHFGPVVAYNFAYLEGVGTYYVLSGDMTVLPAIEQASKYHGAFIYPNGSLVETIDERNPYKDDVRFGNVGLTVTPEGRGFMKHQLALLDRAGRSPSADELALLLLYGKEGPAAPIAAEAGDRRFVLGKNDAMVLRKGPWFACMSAYHCPVAENRWIQDRQNLVSVYHDKCGLIVGGGNTKLQPLWSTFTVGDTSLLSHKPGDTDPKFTPDGELYHVPSEAVLTPGDKPKLDLVYGKEKCAISLEPVDDSTVRLHLTATAGSGLPVEGHITLLPHLDKPLLTAAGASRSLENGQVSLTAEECGGWIEHAGWRLSLPDGARVSWPVKPHNPYVKDGASKSPGEALIVVTVPFANGRQSADLVLTVLP